MMVIDLSRQALATVIDIFRLEARNSFFSFISSLQRGLMSYDAADQSLTADHPQEFDT